MSNAVPFLDLGKARAELSVEIDQAVARVIASGQYIGGPELAAFEAAFADQCKAAHCVGTGNGLDALHLALLALGVGAGDQVIVSSNTFIATWLAVSEVGAVPVAVEPDRYHNLDPALVEAAITSRTKVILPTHLYGQPADIGPLLEIARRHGLKLLEDAAQAHGSTYRGQPIGGHGDLVAWSFYPGKNLGALGDGGAVTTNDPGLAARVRMLGNYGSAEKYVHQERGFNSRLDPIQAAVLSIKLDRLDEWNARRARIAQFYRDELSVTPVVLPEVASFAGPAWHLFVIEVDARAEFQRHLADRGVQTIVHYPIPPHLQAAYADLAFPRGSFPIAERLADRVVSLPIGPHLSDGQAECAVGAVRSWFGR